MTLTPGEPERDARLAAALRLHEPAMTDEEAARLHAQIIAAAAPALAALRRAHLPWWTWAAAWGRIAVPIGLAATLAAAALIARIDVSALIRESAVAANETGATSENGLVLRAATAMASATASASAEQVANRFVVPVSHDAVLHAAMSRVP